DPVDGRWWEQDPLQFAAGDQNVQRYVFNSPTNGTDPSGLSPDLPGAAPFFGNPAAVNRMVMAWQDQQADHSYKPPEKGWYDKYVVGSVGAVGNFAATHGGNTLRTVGGGFEVVAGGFLIATTGWTGIGAAGGYILIAHGADTAIAGVREFASGEP